MGRSLLTSGLGALGGLLGPAGAMVGSSLGDWGSNILGMGDYELKTNSLYSGVSGVPSMHSTDTAVRVRHKEYLGDITGSTGFSIRQYKLQPGASDTFPWLSNISGMYQQYSIKGVVFEFVSTSADALNAVNTALGSIIMGVQYNVSLPTYQSEAEMLQSEGSIVGRPSRNLILPIECDPNQQVMSHLFTRTGVLPVGTDYQFYDWANVSIATVGMQAAANIGKLWVSYDIEFSKPRMAYGGSWPGDFTRICNGPYTAATNVLGDIQTNPFGNLGITVAAGAAGWQRVQFPNTITSGRYLISVEWQGAVAAAASLPVRTFNNLTLANNFFNLSSSGDYLLPSAGAVSSRMCYICVVTVDGYNVNGSYLELGTAGTLPTTSQFVNIQVINIPGTDTPF